VLVDNFVGNPGPATIMEENKSEFDFFHPQFDVNFYQTVADETNRYARVSQEKKDRDPKWYDTNAAEIHSNIAFYIIMGIIVAPSQDMYFTKDKLFRQTAIHERITRNRMDKLHQYVTIQ
jgi:hypothetical protein